MAARVLRSISTPAPLKMPRKLSTAGLDGLSRSVDERATQGRAPRCWSSAGPGVGVRRGGRGGSRLDRQPSGRSGSVTVEQAALDVCHGRGGWPAAGSLVAQPLGREALPWGVRPSSTRLRPQMYCSVEMYRAMVVAVCRGAGVAVEGTAAKRTRPVGYAFVFGRCWCPALVEFGGFECDRSEYVSDEEVEARAASSGSRPASAKASRSRSPRARALGPSMGPLRSRFTAPGWDSRWVLNSTASDCRRCRQGRVRVGEPVEVDPAEEPFDECPQHRRLVAESRCTPRWAPLPPARRCHVLSPRRRRRC